MLQNPLPTDCFTQIERYIDGGLSATAQSVFETEMENDADLRAAVYTSRAIRFWQRKMSDEQMEEYAQIVSSNAEQAEIHNMYQLAFTAAMHEPTPSDAAHTHLAALQKQMQRPNKMLTYFKYAVAAILLVSVAIAGLRLLFAPSVDTPKNIVITPQKPKNTPIIAPENNIVPSNTAENDKIINDKNTLKSPLKPININKNTPIAYQKAIIDYEKMYNTLDKTLQDSLNLEERLNRINDQNTACIRSLANAASTPKNDGYSYRKNIAITKNAAFDTLTDSAKIQALQAHKSVLEARIAIAETRKIRLIDYCKQTQDALNNCLKNKH